jgi:hypothetical protein
MHIILAPGHTLKRTANTEPAAMASMILKITLNNYNILGPGELSIVTAAG